RAVSLAARPAERPVHESAGNARRLGITDRRRRGADRRARARRRAVSDRDAVGHARATRRPRPRARAATGAGAALGLLPAPGGARRGLCPTTSLWDTRMIAPVLALIGWTFVMWFWMYATRLPAMQKVSVDLGEMSRTGAKLQLPPEVSRVADNYNHLHEQPTIFYALALAAHVIGAGDAINVGLAWAYVGLRIVHCLVQAAR